MKKTGEILRKSREEKGLSLHEVGIFLKINTRILQAIEDGDIEKLPAKTFLRGFVQSYAKYLKLDPNYVLKIFSEELKPPFVEAEALLEEKLTANKEELTNQPTDAVGTVEPEVSSPASEKKTSLYVGTSVGSDSIKQKMLIISVLGFFLVFIVYIGNSLIRRYQKEASLNVDVPVVETAPKHTTPETLLSSPPAAAGSSISALPTVSTGSPLASPTAPSTPSDSKK
ncbi:MAG: helix-turn-helix domain-containing protein, partial [Bdellovibrionales bacterium]